MSSSSKHAPSEPGIRLLPEPRHPSTTRRRRNVVGLVKGKSDGGNDSGSCSGGSIGSATCRVVEVVAVAVAVAVVQK